MTRYFYILSLVLLCTSCHTLDEWPNSPVGNFDALWTEVDRHYCFFSEKNIDWDDVYTKYRPLVREKMTQEQLFDICADMLDELRDGHVNLSSYFNTSYYRRWWTDYPQNYNERLVQEHYLHFDYRTVGGTYYGYIHGNIGYIRYPSFSYSIGDSNLNAILAYFASCNGIIIDIRDNGGGALTNVECWVRRFIDAPMTAGYIIHKNGPGHNDFSAPFPFSYEPAAEGCIMWTKPVAVLTNRSTFSAANNFASIMRTLPNVRLVGATTGGGSGMPYSSELPCGWGVRFSACSILDPQGQTTETGIAPSEGCAVNMSPDDESRGVDSIIERAIEVINNM